MSRFNNRRGRLRALLADSVCRYPAPVYDPISCRMADDLDFEVGLIGGSIASFCVLGAPDLILITLTELAEQIRRMARACEMPIIVDADHGYGNALNVQRTVEELEAAGAAGLTIEDTLLPQAFGNTEASLIPIEECVGKLRAAVAARRDPDLVIIARTSASAAPIDEVAERSRAYQEAGADAIFFLGVRTLSELRALSDAVRIPIVLGAPAAVIADDVKLLADHGVRICTKGHPAFLAGVQASWEVLNALKNGTELPPTASKELMHKVTRSREYASAMANYMATD